MEHQAVQSTVQSKDTNRWIICLSSFFMQFLVFGIQNSFGILFVSLREEFKSSEMTTAWIGTLSLTIMYFLGPLMTICCRTFGCHFIACTGSVLATAGLFCSSYVSDLRLLFVTYSLGWGIGTSMCYYSSLGVLNIHFKTRLSLAYGIAMAGAGFGVPATSKLISFLVVKGGWRLAVRSISAAGPILFCCGLIFLWRANKSEEKQHSVVVRDSTTSCISWYKRCISKLPKLSKLLFDYEMFATNKTLCVWTLSLSLILSGCLIPFVYLIRMADDVGVPRSESTLLIGYLAITQAVSKVIFGQLGDMEATSRITFLQIFALINAVNTTLCTLALNYASFIVFVVVFGICDGCFAVMFSMGTHLIVGDKDMPRAFGNVCSIVALVQAIGTPLAGRIYDIFGEYSIAFFVSGGLSTIGVCVMFLVPLFLPHQENCSNTSSNEILPLLSLGNQETTASPDKPAIKTCLYMYHKHTCTSNCVPCSDFISLSGCPRYSIWSPYKTSDWV